MDRNPNVSPFGNPWQGFAHVDHRVEEYEGILRTLRFALIQLNKFWVEINSFPVFMNEMKGSSIREIERLLQWFQQTPRWHEVLLQPRLISDLRQPPLRAALLDFVECVSRAGDLRASTLEIQSRPLPEVSALQSSLAQLGLAIALTRQLGLEGGKIIDVQCRIHEVSRRLERNRKIHGFFGKLSSKWGLPEATCLFQCARLFRCMDLIRQTPREILSWRSPQILGEQQKIRIQSWQDRVKATLESRKGLMQHFELHQAASANSLRELATALKKGGAFRAFTTAFKDANKFYETLLKPEINVKVVSKETPENRADRLLEWATYLEKKVVFENSTEGRAFFAPHFNGIDTDFTQALKTHDWGCELRSEMQVGNTATLEGQRDAEYCAKLLEWAFSAPAAALWGAAEESGNAEALQAQKFLLEPEYDLGRGFQSVAREEEVRLIEVTRLVESLENLTIRPETTLNRLSELRGLVEERLLLLRRIESWSEMRSLLKNHFLGEETDLTLIENPRLYIEFIETAPLPESLRNSLLTAHGPARLHDTRSLVAPALNGLVAVKDHLQRLEIATNGQSRMLEDEPLLDLIQRLQRALKNPQGLAEWVDQAKTQTRWQQ
ncbi:hypothetical protein WDW37_11405 [Bdellovibrionota bacterium FG-1]